MIQANNLVHAGNQISTNEQNHANYNYLSNAAFMAKAELRKTMEAMQMEINQLRTKNHLLENDNRRLRDEVINYRMEEIKKYRETKEAIMHIA